MKVQVVCLKAAESKGGTLDLAKVGADAREATQDSTAVGFVEEPGRETFFSAPILEEADVAQIVDSSGAKAMTTILDALEERGEKSPREAVNQ